MVYFLSLSLASLTVTKPHKLWTFLLLLQHFPGSQTSRSTSSRLSYMCNLRFELKLLILYNQSNLHCDIFVNPASTYTYYRPLILFHQSKFTETRVIFCDKQIRLRDFSTKLRQLDVIVWDPRKMPPGKR